MQTPFDDDRRRERLKQLGWTRHLVRGTRNRLVWVWRDGAGEEWSEAEAFTELEKHEQDDT